MYNIVWATAFCLVVIPLLVRYAPQLWLMDKPDDRKQHVGDVPVVGGVAIYLAFVFGCVLAGFDVVPVALVLLALILVLLGSIDDAVGLSIRLRLAVQIGVASAMVIFGDVRIEDLGGLFGSTDIILPPPVSLVFTVICTVGGINAINMIDGLDGLAGSLLLVSYSALAFVAYSAGETEVSYILGLISAGLVAFLFYNCRLFRPKAAVFLGDAGSMFLGLVLVWFFVDLSQGPSPALTATSAGWLLGLPLLETTAIMAVRILERRSPFEAGQDHLHHRLRRMGLSVNKTVGVMLLMHSCLVAMGLAFAQSSGAEAVLFWVFVGLIVVHLVISRTVSELSAMKMIGCINVEVSKVSSISWWKYLFK